MIFSAESEPFNLNFDHVTSNNCFIFFVAICLSASLAHAKIIKFAAQDSPPFNYAVGTEIKGASHDIMVQACEKLHWQCQMEIVPQKRALTLTEAGQYDGVWGIIHLSQRDKYLNYSDPTWTAHLCYTGVQGQLGSFTKLNDLKGFTIIGVRSSASFQRAEDLKQKFEDVRLVESNSYPEAFEDLFKNKYGAKTAVASYSEVSRYMIEEKQFKKPTQILNVEPVKFRVGFSKKMDLDIVSQFNRTLTEMRKSGQLKKILSVYNMTE